MTDLLTSPDVGVQHLDDELSKARENLRNIEEGIKSLTGRNAAEFNRFRRGGGRGSFREGGGPFRGHFNEPSNGSFDNNREGPVGRFAGAKRRFSALGRNVEDQDNPGWKRSRQSLDYQDGSNHQNDFYDEDLHGKKPTIASLVTVTQKDVKSRDEAIAELKTEEKRDVAVRNRRMFGMLLGTLQKFKKDEDSKDKNFKDQEKRQREIEQKLEESKRKEHLQMQQEKEKLLEKRRRQQAELRRLQRKKALIAATDSQISQMKRLQNFIQTNSKPPIFYMPAKHTIRTIELQKKSQKRLEEMIKRKQEEMEQELKFIEDSTVKLDSGDEDAQDDDHVTSEVMVEGCDSKTADVQVHVEQKTIQDELNELTDAATVTYEVNFDVDDHQTT